MDKCSLIVEIDTSMIEIDLSTNKWGGAAVPITAVYCS